MTRFFFCLLPLLFIAGAANAQPVYPIPVAGIYSSAVQTAPQAVDVDGIPTEPPTQSVAFVLELDGTRLVCTNASPDMVITITYTVPNFGDRMSAKAYAYPFPDCGTGTEQPKSLPSDETAYFFFNPPATPMIIAP